MLSLLIAPRIQSALHLLILSWSLLVPVMSPHSLLGSLTSPHSLSPSLLPSLSLSFTYLCLRVPYRPSISLSPLTSPLSVLAFVLSPYCGLVPIYLLYVS